MTIEKKFIQQNLRELQIKEYIFSVLGKVGVAHVKLQRTPLGEKILISCSRPGLVVGRAGSNIQRFGSSRFKGIAHRALMDAMNAGALGIEILISGIVPSQRAKTWRFYAGYLKKCGDVAIEGVDIAYRIAIIKRGVIGIKVSVMPPSTILPDRIDIHEPATVVAEEVTGAPEVKELEETVEAVSEEKPKKARKAAKTDEAKPKRAPRKKTAKKESEEPAEKAAEEESQ